MYIVVDCEIKDTIKAVNLENGNIIYFYLNKNLVVFNFPNTEHVKTVKNLDKDRVITFLRQLGMISCLDDLNQGLEEFDLAFLE